MAKGHVPPGTVAARIRTHPLPPDGFNPRAASPQELRHYGLPQRPDPAIRPQLTSLWDEVFSRKLTYIVPTFRPMEEPRPSIKRPGRPRQDLVTTTNNTWSGAVVHATGGETFNWVTGQWNVPDVAPAAKGEGLWQSSAWIGIDGDPDITQIGTMQIVSADSSGNLTKECYAWYEWWDKSVNSPWQQITNFKVNFGDTMLGLICMDSPSEAHYNLYNVTSGILAAWKLLVPPSNTVTSLENQAEWILERPETKVNYNPPLPSFGEVYFDGARCGNGLDLEVDGGTDTAINMLVNGITVATTTVETPTLIKIAYTG